MVDYIRDLRPAKWGSGVRLHGNNFEAPMSALGQKRTLTRVGRMSALPPKADIPVSPKKKGTGTMAGPPNRPHYPFVTTGGGGGAFPLPYGA